MSCVNVVEITIPNTEYGGGDLKNQNGYRGRESGVQRFLIGGGGWMVSAGGALFQT